MSTSERVAGTARETTVAEVRPGRVFGRALRARRLQAGLTQVQLGALAGMSQAALSRLERGQGVPTFAVLHRLAQAMESDLLICVSLSGTFRAAFREAGASAPRTPSSTTRQRMRPPAAAPRGSWRGVGAGRL
ncbi:helix-turn-helix domain-containing protein [Streptomyces sp. NPDC056831]|uniref:helix-turn-helix domain-containing protein n=1 Tax=Streptomyces sp. NPDC056831 TaxID=3345954 RepID=UPI00367DAF7D